MQKANGQLRKTAGPPWQCLAQQCSAGCQRCTLCRSEIARGHGQWCDLRPSSVLGQDGSETKKIGLGFGLGPAGLVLCCETRSCHARRHNDLEGHSNFSSTIYSFSTVFCVWNITTVEINSGVHLLKS